MSKQEELTVGILRNQGILRKVGTHTVRTLIVDNTNKVLLASGSDIPHNGDKRSLRGRKSKKA